MTCAGCAGPGRGWSGRGRRAARRGAAAGGGRPAPGRARRAGPGRRRAGRACGGRGGRRRAGRATPARRGGPRRAARRRARSPYAVLASAVRCGKSAPSCGTQATPLRCGGRAVTSVSPSRSSAWARGVRPSRARSRVVLPAPLGPTTAMVVPGSASRVSSLKPVTSACRDQSCSRCRRRRRCRRRAASCVPWARSFVRRRPAAGRAARAAGGAGPAAAQGDEYGHGDREQQQRDGGGGLRLRPGAADRPGAAGSGWCRGGCPAKVMVAPNSPSARAQVRAAPGGEAGGDHGQGDGEEHPYR